MPLVGAGNVNIVPNVLPAKLQLTPKDSKRCTYFQTQKGDLILIYICIHNDVLHILISLFEFFINGNRFSA